MIQETDSLRSRPEVEPVALTPYALLEWEIRSLQHQVRVFESGAYDNPEVPSSPSEKVIDG